MNKPKLPEVKPDIPDIEYTGSGIELPLMPASSRTNHACPAKSVPPRQRSGKQADLRCQLLWCNLADAEETPLFHEHQLYR